MKKSISLLLCCVMIFSSFSFVFADFGSTDSTNLYNLYQRANSIWNYINNYMPTYSQISTISGNVADIYTRLGTINTTLGTLSTISNTLTTISNALNYGSHTITYWVNSISTWMSPIYSAISSIPVDLSTLIGALGFTDSNSVYHPYLNNIDLSTKYITPSEWIASYRYSNAHSQLVSADGTYQMPLIPANSNNGSFNMYTRYWTQGTPLGNIAYLLHDYMISFCRAYQNNFNVGFTDFNSLQSALSWTDIESSITFTPTSQTNGLYTWLKNIQVPVARLSYVLASDERIAAQEAAAANEEAVVDNFIDSSGSGAASANDIGSVSDLSSGYKDNFGSDASVSGIFDIFNSDHMGWFSSETKNQLDTTTTLTRAKSLESDTPLLDKQIEDIYNSLGVKMP